LADLIILYEIFYYVHSTAMRWTSSR